MKSLMASKAGMKRLVSDSYRDRYISKSISGL